MGMRLVSAKILSLMIVFSMILSGTLIAAEKPDDAVQESPPADIITASDYPFRTVYPSLAQLESWYNTLVSEYPGLVTKIDIGNSWQGRDLWVLELTANEDTVVAEKPGIMITGGTHAREWSGMQATAYFAWMMLYNYETNDTIHWQLNNRKIYLAPQVNPDGYYYDGNGNYAAKLSWRKNRLPIDIDHDGDIDTYGVDLNRNWDAAWASGNNDPTALDYHGEYPFSEYETQALRNFILNNSIESFQDIHSYAGTLLIPWCYTGNPSPHDTWYRGTAAKMTSLTTQMGAATTYSYGQPDETIGYSAPGGSIDWTYDALGIQSYCFELATGGAGFYPTTANIMTINRDVDDALLYQTRVADIDIGDGTANLFPPVPYIVYGHLYGHTAPKPGTQVTVTDKVTSETLTIMTDSNGYFELNFGNLASYTTAHEFNLAAPGHSRDFYIGSEWGKKFELTETEPVDSFTVEHWGQWYNSTSFTKYMTHLTQTVNGLNAYRLENASMLVQASTSFTSNSATTQYTGMRVYRRSSAGVETEITSGVSAIVSRSVNGNGLQSVGWFCPGADLSPGDSIVVKVYQATVNPPTTLWATFTTGQIGYGRMDQETWTIYYYTSRTTSGTTATNRFYWGDGTYNSRIINMRLSNLEDGPDDPRDHNMINWIHSGTNVSSYKIYRSDAEGGTYYKIADVPAGTYTYTDYERGQEDSTLWWYRVNAVSPSGFEGQDNVSIQEPGTGTPYSINLAGRSGWVFVSYPVTVTGNIETVLNDATNGDAGTNWDVAKTWSNQQKKWLTYRKGGTMNTFTNLNNTMGVWLHLTANGADQALQLPSTGAYPGTTQIYLYTGWNLVGYPSATARLASNTLPAQADMVSEWQSASPYIVDRAPGAVTMSHGNGYWVRVTADCVWTVQP
jgi:murein tripeptide amidase MpaA